MDLQQAAELLIDCEREGLDDHSFGDSERGWWCGGEQIAEGYFSGERARVTFLKENITFESFEARRLKDLGTPAINGIRRNDPASVGWSL